MISIICGVFLLVVSAFGADITVENSCPSSAVQVVGSQYFRILNDTCFLFMVYDRVVYDTAKSKCQDDGGSLAMPKTKHINDFLIKEGKTFKDISPMWIGMHDKVEEGQMVWEDGSDVDSWNNFHWSNGGLFGGGEDCVALDANDEKWHDYGCLNTGILSFVGVARNAKLHFICQYPTKQDGGKGDKGGDDSVGKGGQGGNDSVGKGDQGGDDSVGKGDQGADDSVGKGGQGGDDSVGKGGQGGDDSGDDDGQVATVDDDKCPPFNCPDLDCGMDGFKMQDGCQLCKCE